MDGTTVGTDYVSVSGSVSRSPVDEPEILAALDRLNGIVNGNVEMVLKLSKRLEPIRNIPEDNSKSPDVVKPKQCDLALRISNLGDSLLQSNNELLKIEATIEI